METWNIFGISVDGPSHQKNQTVCQDACNYSIITQNVAVISVADGLGSVRFPEIGASLATTFSVDYVKEHIEELLESENGNEEFLTTFYRNLIENTRIHLKEAAIEKGCEFDDLASTLLVVFLNGSTASIAHIGDGAAVVKIGEQYELLSEPEQSEYSNEVYPLTTDQWEQHLRIKQFEDIEAVAVFTDGCQSALLSKADDIWKPYNEAFAYLFSWANTKTDENQAKEEIEIFLRTNMATKSSDDKTLVFAIKH